MNQKKIDTWDYQWQYAIWNNKKLLSLLSPPVLITRSILSTGTNESCEKISSLTFKNVQKELKPKKNKDLFKKVEAQQKKKYVKK